MWRLPDFICRHHWSRESPVKRLNISSFQPTQWLSLTVDVDWWKSQCWLKAPYISLFHWALCASAISIDVSKVGVALFPSFRIFYLSDYRHIWKEWQVINKTFQLHRKDNHESETYYLPYQVPSILNISTIFPGTSSQFIGKNHLHFFINYHLK